MTTDTTDAGSMIEQLEGMATEIIKMVNELSAKIEALEAKMDGQHEHMGKHMAHHHKLLKAIAEHSGVDSDSMSEA